jgi:hypothetical protein
MDKCPICDAECTNETYCESVGMVEQHIKCPNHCWNYTFAYGSTEIHVGDFMTGYHYTTSPEERSKISNAIQALILHYKEEYNKTKEVNA